MKKVKQFLLVICFLFISGYSFGQFDSTSTKDIIQSIDFKRAVYLSVNVGGTSVTLETKTLQFVYEEKYMKSFDERGVVVFIPYDKIQAINFSPYNSRIKTPTEFRIILIY